MVQVCFEMHPSLVAALQGLAAQQHCTMDELLLKLINEGLTLELKIREIKVLEQAQRPQN